MNTHPASMQDILKTNWRGSIPVKLSLAPSSLSSPKGPESIHVLLPRNTYLHLSLEKQVRYFHRFAPQNLSFASYRSVSQDDEGEERQRQDDHALKSNSPNTTNGAAPASAPNDDHNNSFTDTNNVKDDASPTEHSTEKLQDKKEQQLFNTFNSKRQLDESFAEEHDSSSSSYPPCWFEDEATGTPLRWQLFVGVVYDLIQMKRFESWSDDRTTCSGKTRRRMIPWNIRVHFTSYPSTLLPLTTAGKDDVEHIVFQNYLNSLKQALYIQHQSNRIAKNLNKKSHMILWNGIRNNRWDDESATTVTATSFDEVFFFELNAVPVSVNSANNHHRTSIVRQVPIRLLVNDEPPFTRPCPFQSDDAKETVSACTLEDILKGWLLNLFDYKFCCCIQGIQVPLNTPVNDLWKMLCSPDRFLYISVVTKFIPEDKA